MLLNIQYPVPFLRWAEEVLNAVDLVPCNCLRRQSDLGLLISESFCSMCNLGCIEGKEESETSGQEERRKIWLDLFFFFFPFTLLSSFKWLRKGLKVKNAKDKLKLMLELSVSEVS